MTALSGDRTDSIGRDTSVIREVTGASDVEPDRTTPFRITIIDVLYSSPVNSRWRPSDDSGVATVRTGSSRDWLRDNPLFGRSAFVDGDGRANSHQPRE